MLFVRHSYNKNRVLNLETDVEMEVIVDDLGSNM